MNQPAARPFLVRRRCGAKLTACFQDGFGRCLLFAAGKTTFRGRRVNGAAPEGRGMFAEH